MNNTKISQFSESTLEALSYNNEHQYYVYCFTHLKKNKILYIGYGYGNHIFEHEAQAYDIEAVSSPTKQDLKLKAIQKCKKLGRFIINHHLSKQEAIASANTLINFNQIILKQKIKNKSSDASILGYCVEDLNQLYHFEPCSVNHIVSDGLILAVKIPDAFQLCRDENQSHQDEKYPDNLKSQTLGLWSIGKDRLKKIKYIIGINAQAKNAVVSAYEISGFEPISTEVNGKIKTQYLFHTDTNSIDTLNKLGLAQKSLPDLKFSVGSDKAYIHPQTPTQTASSEE